MELWADNCDIFRMCKLGPGISPPELVQPNLPATASGKVRAPAGPPKNKLSLVVNFYFFIIGGCRERPGLEDY